MKTSMNEQTHFLIKMYLSHFIRERVSKRLWKGWCWFCERGGLETGTDCYIFAQSSDHSSTSSSSCWAAKPWVTEGPLELVLTPRASNCDRKWLQLQLELSPRTAPSRLWNLVIQLFDVHLLPLGVRICTEFNHVHRSRWYSDIFDRMHLFLRPFAYLYRCISWLTARSRVNMLQGSFKKSTKSIYKSCIFNINVKTGFGIQ